MAINQPDANPVDNRRFQVEVLPPSELLKSSRRTLLSHINDFLNDLYSVHGHPRRSGELPPNHMYSGMRISSEDQLVHELGDSGLIAVCLDKELDDEPSQALRKIEKFDGTQPGMYGKVVAISGLKPWKGNLVRFYLRLQELKGQDETASLDDLQLRQLAKQYALSANNHAAPTWDWEVTTTCSINSPRYRGQGLVIRCVDALIEAIQARQASLKATDDPMGGLPLKLWSTTLEGSGSTEYWLRRGFIREGVIDDAPAGVWSSIKPFQVSTLSKLVD